MKPDDRQLTDQESAPTTSDDTVSVGSGPEAMEPSGPPGDSGWRLWPPSPKMQIALIAVGFGLFNLILIAIWAVVMVYRF